MIELIFVIVVIAILAGLAVPKMLLIKNDASVTKELANIEILKNDLSLYYARHSKLPDGLINPIHFTQISNIFWSDNTTIDFKFPKETCIKIKIDNENASITFSPINNPIPLCKTLQFALAKSSLLNLENNTIKDKMISLGGGSIYDTSNVK